MVGWQNFTPAKDEGSRYGLRDYPLGIESFHGPPPASENDEPVSDTSDHNNSAPYDKNDGWQALTVLDGYLYFGVAFLWCSGAEAATDVLQYGHRRPSADQRRSHLNDCVTPAAVFVLSNKGKAA
ncbi:hypothetical protein [Burkholderia thailandensis]|uniref:hypothetical protein n=1 Tax=Burkholderia thailandensis TaxID=57975 RepID=UPI0029902100|nr:hypothetical protein [Burkholderia thailandensis]